MLNGVLARVPTIDREKSDTWHFAEYVLGPMLSGRPELFGTRELVATLSAIIGTGNKLVVLRDDGASMIVNRDRGVKHEGLWLSNAHSLPGRKVYTFAGGTTSRGTACNAWDQARELDRAWSRVSAHDLSDDDARAAECEMDDRPRTPAELEYGEFHLEDFEGWDYEDIVDAIQSDPYTIADAIQRHLD